MSTNKGLQKELSVLSGLTAAAFLFMGRRKWATVAGGLAVGLRLLPSLPYSFRGKSVVITGGSRGLGFVLAQKLLAEGCDVTLLARDQFELDKAWAKLSQDCRDQLFVVRTDITDKKSMARAVEEVLRKNGRVDLLINNAGSISAGPLEAMNRDDFEAQMNVHFYGAMNAIETCLPVFRRQKEGQIVNISSIGGKIPVPHLAPYCASKYALAGYSQTLTAELMKENIKVLTVYPGLMRTGSAIQAVLKGDHEKEFAWFTVANSLPGLSMSAEKAAQKIVKAIREGRTDLRLSMPTRMAIWFQQLFPETFHVLMGFANEFLPSKTSSLRKTGAESQAWLNRQPWSGPIQKLQRLTQRNYNEMEKSDADYNLNLKSH